MHTVNLSQSAGGCVSRKADNVDLARALIEMRGQFNVDLWRNGKRIDSRTFRNGITNEGKNKLLGVMFNAATQISTWYIGLIDNTGFSALAAGDIYDNINQAGNGWDEFSNYTDNANANSTVTRPTWTEGAPSGQSITNASPVIFDITGSGTVKGLFLAGGTNAQTKGDHTAGTANVLWATALFSGGDVAVLNADQLKVTYTVSA